MDPRLNFDILFSIKNLLKVFSAKCYFKSALFIGTVFRNDLSLKWTTWNEEKTLVLRKKTFLVIKIKFTGETHFLGVI